MAEAGAAQPSPDPVTTTVLWDTVVGARLEELLYGFLHALSASELTWRAGSDRGVTAADGGRDLEAIFSRPTPEGDLDQERWWVEAKGRSGTVPKEDVVTGVMSAAGRSDLDVYVFCTNSRFSNPTRDWVSEWQKGHPRPKVRLWDRDRLAVLARSHPTVTARVLPEALDDDQRLELLLERFHRLGETPTETDLEYYWARPDVVKAHDGCVSLVAMLAYAESQETLGDRPWGTLLDGNDDTNVEVIIEALVRLPLLVAPARPRPVIMDRVRTTSAYLVLTVISRTPAELLSLLFHRPGVALDGERWDAMLGTDTDSFWYRNVSGPILARLQSELEDVCAGDCVRVSSDNAAFPPRLEGKQYWRRFDTRVEESSSDGRLVIEWHTKPCAVGLPLNEERGCPLVQGPEPSPERFRELQAVVAFRSKHPDGQFGIHSDIEIELNLDAAIGPREPIAAAFWRATTFEDRR